MCTLDAVLVDILQNWSINISCKKCLHSVKKLGFSTFLQIGAHGKPVVFLHPKDCGGVLVEIEEA